ncbi:MAG TPA: hypothetical protein PKA74_19660 [Bauldia sp.]|nr:hypothetical protein [Bauldia sp.]
MAALIADGQLGRAMLDLIDLARIEAIAAPVRVLVAECCRISGERARKSASGGRSQSVAQLNPRRLAALARPRSLPVERFRACVNLVECGEIGRALFHAADLLDVPELKPRVEALIDQCRAMRKLRLHERAGEGWPEGSEVGDSHVAIPAGSETTVICFTGRGSRFGISSYFLRSLLQMHRVNLVLVFDWDEVGYLAGVRGLGDTMEESVARLSAMCARLGTRRLVVLGTSLGGFAAMRYALALGADATLALAPRLHVFDNPANLASLRAAVGDEVTAESIDVRAHHHAAERAPLTWIVYGTANEADVRSAAHMRGLDGVVEIPLEGIGDHRLITRLAVSGEFTPLFARFLEAAGAGAWRPLEA